MATGVTQEQQLVNCARCGAPVSNIDLAQPKVYCTDCGAEIDVPEPVRERVRSYVAEMQSEEHRLATAERAEVQVRKYTAVVKSGRYGIWMLIWVAGIMPVSVTAIVIELPLLGLSDQQLVGQVAYAAAIVLVVVPIIVVFILSRRKLQAAKRLNTPEMRPPTVSVPCQSCGALIAFELGETSKICSYCQASNIAPTAVDKPMLHWVSDNALAVDSARKRDEGEAQVALAHAVTASNRVFGILRIVGILAPGAFFLAIGFSFYDDGSRQDERGTVLFLALGVLWLTAVGLRAVVRSARRTKAGAHARKHGPNSRAQGT